MFSRCGRILVLPQTDRFAGAAFYLQIAEVPFGLGRQGIIAYYNVQGSTIDFDVFVFKVSAECAGCSIKCSRHYERHAMVLEYEI